MPLNGTTFTARPLCREFNVAVNHIANRLWPQGWDVSADAPGTYEALRGRLDAGKRLVVYSGGSERTIFDCPETNYAFRAWHDWCHYKGRHDFSMAGELGASWMMMDHLEALYRGHAKLPTWCDLVDVEVNAQADYFDRHGRFPDDQIGFVRAEMARRGHSFA